jgi:hypothetical protein
MLWQHSVPRVLFLLRQHARVCQCSAAHPLQYKTHRKTIGLRRTVAVFPGMRRNLQVQLSSLHSYTREDKWCTGQRVCAGAAHESV